MSRDPDERFWAKVDKNGPGGCWLWTASGSTVGYGQFWQGKLVAAHRWSYEHVVGPIPDGLELDHLCRVRQCVNPDHLEPVTGRENTLRGHTIAAVNAAKTHCPQGHPLSGANLQMDRGRRRCRTCHNEGMRNR